MGQEIFIGSPLQVLKLDENWVDGSDSRLEASGTSSNGDVPSSVGLMGGRSDVLLLKQSPGHDSSDKEDEMLGSSSSGRSSSKGLAGLQNLGNTCFMNSALQCLAHTPDLVEFFLQDYSKEINQDNPLGMEGELAVAFGELIRKLWAGKEVVVPRQFKGKLSRFAPQFSGYNQHDSQELLAFLLDGLHEDLNRVKLKPYIEVKDGDGRPDAEVAEEYWANHKARNNSIIVDLFQGQYKSTLVCPVCHKVSVTFDPFMYLSLPLPELQSVTLSVFAGDGSGAPESYTVQVSRQGRGRELYQTLSEACKLKKDEKLVIAKVENYRLQQSLPETSQLSLRDSACLAAYRLRAPSSSTSGRLVLYHGRLEETMYSSKRFTFYGAPLMASLPSEGMDSGADLYQLVKKTVGFLKRGSGAEAEEEEEQSGDEQWPFQIYLTDEKGSAAGQKIDPFGELPTLFSCMPEERRYIVLNWSRRGLEQYSVKDLDDLPEVASGTRRQWRESVSLYACLEAFMKEEPLGPDDMWYCPRCKEHRQASKKLDLWRMPEVLVVHLKRFSYSRFLKNKLDTLVEFPVHDLDFSKYLSQKIPPYELFAVSNHYGGMGCGHYTAYAKLCNENKWYNFDDSHVSSIGSDDVRTPAAYVLFYRRKRRSSSSEEAEPYSGKQQQAAASGMV